MTDMLAVPLKKPSEVNVITPLKNLLQSAYNSGASKPTAAGATDFNGIVEEFSKLRNTAIWKFYDKYESSLDVVYG